MKTMLPKLPDHASKRIIPGASSVVVGAGASGMAAAELLDFLGAGVRIVDSGRLSDSVREMATRRGWETREGGHGPEQFADAELVVLSPGVNRRKLSPWLEQLGPDQVISELELALGFVDEPIIAVTGTSGKTTTTTLIGAFLEAMGRKVFVGGNIGTPLCRYALDRRTNNREKADILVLEVSSFQLLNTTSLHPKVAVLLNISPNHLDYHQDMDEYVQAKLSLFAGQEPQDTAIISGELRELVESHLKIRSRKVFVEPVSRLTCPALPGRHNQGNIESAFQACKAFGLDEAAAQKALDGFEALPHRLQGFAEYHGVLFVDDSKGTTVQSLRAALEAFDRPLLLLAGGVFKGGDLAGLKPLLTQKVRHVGLFGASREIFEQAWTEANVPLSWEPTLEAAMDRLWATAKEKDVMLLSPATASFDLFANYKERGMAFQRHAKVLAERDHG
ncbi:UDP-N-acetylmuramoylalanine--D-glutamate ligase [Desulfonatronum thiosulfatophilum]|uniref:UDP-N-acetylmuramoylalanine--D-glutamate ligase n=1 Tax=Desulfonatronum thiosulfatophilum TaxID=617002 RepID=A0A1G6ANI2_9BACT|nr:UDP-N-acetylmuramoyl-L-alanine--D-glutamate ligase [Desulfonatronum thiosulfatophilum]SDB09877.1 UDP-N-acetylmuramoylalanine--D-glutamate ligase [Desulfonatronum thiosulfatophilum]